VLLRRPEKLKMDELSTRVWDWLKRFQGEIKISSPAEDLL
jgi:hypothetical protein